MSCNHFIARACACVATELSGRQVIHHLRLTDSPAAGLGSAVRLRNGGRAGEDQPEKRPVNDNA
ncbi:MAG: hypothetical protein P8008_04400 [Gammaproteobacteria bacterium]